MLIVFGTCLKKPIEKKLTPIFIRIRDLLDFSGTDWFENNLLKDFI